MSTDFKNNIKNIRTTSPDYYLLEVTVQNHVLYIYKFEIKSLLSVLLSSLTDRNFNTSRPIYVILWEMKNHYRNIWFMKIQNISIFLFLKKQPQKRTNFSTFYLIFKGPPFQYHNIISCNILHLEIDFWNLSWKMIVSS